MGEVQVDEAYGDGEGEQDESGGREVPDEFGLFAVLVEVVGVGDDHRDAHRKAQEEEKPRKSSAPGIPLDGHRRSLRLRQEQAVNLQEQSADKRVARGCPSSIMRRVGDLWSAALALA